MMPALKLKKLFIQYYRVLVNLNRGSCMKMWFPPVLLLARLPKFILKTNKFILETNKFNLKTKNT